ncbi:MAG: uracil-DNA glycosylase family 4 [Alteromonas macleodii]|jgi:uracil-DNA glycosylase family 4
MESCIEYWTAKALLDWQVEMGVNEAIGDEPVDRYGLQDVKPAPKPVQTKPASPPIHAAEQDINQISAARNAAHAAQDLAGLYAAMSAFNGCELKAAARNLIFSDGVAGAPVMIIADAPDRYDDRVGEMFVGRKGALLDKMLAAIGLSRSGTTPIYAAPILPWNPPQDRDPNKDEMAMMLPFLQRHITLAAPKFLILMGNGPCQALLNKSGMTRMHGSWTDIQIGPVSLPAIPMFAPSYLLTTPAAKRDAWQDLLSLKAHLKDLT